MGKLREWLQAVDQISNLDNEVRRNADSMEVFADGDAAVRIGEWREWRRASLEAGRQLPPSLFKKGKER